MPRFRILAPTTTTMTDTQTDLIYPTKALILTSFECSSRMPSLVQFKDEIPRYHRRLNIQIINRLSISKLEIYKLEMFELEIFELEIFLNLHEMPHRNST